MMTEITQCTFIYYDLFKTAHNNISYCSKIPFKVE